MSIGIRTDASNGEPSVKHMKRRKNSISSILKKKSKVTRTADYCLDRIRTTSMKTEPSDNIPEEILLTTQSRAYKKHSPKPATPMVHQNEQNQIIKLNLEFCFRDCDHRPRKFETGSRASVKKPSSFFGGKGIDISNVKKRLNELKQGSFKFLEKNTKRSLEAMKQKSRKPSYDLSKVINSSRAFRGNDENKRNEIQGRLSNLIKGSYSNTKLKNTQEELKTMKKMLDIRKAKGDSKKYNLNNL